MKTLLLFLLSSCSLFAQLNITRPFYVAGVLKPAAAGGGGAAYSEVQTNFYISSGAAITHTITFSSATANNLLVICATSDALVNGAPSGWTQAATAADFVGSTIFYKVAAGGETSAIVGVSSSAHAVLWVGEWSGMATSSPLDQTATATAQGDPTATGTTGTTSQGDELLVALGGISTSGGTPTFVGVDGSFTAKTDLLRTASGASHRMIVATRKVSATGTYGPNFDMNSSGSSHNVGIIATFKITTP